MTESVKRQPVITYMYVAKLSKTYTHKTNAIELFLMVFSIKQNLSLISKRYIQEVVECRISDVKSDSNAVTSTT